jgi:rare lipoprotein A
MKILCAAATAALIAFSATANAKAVTGLASWYKMGRVTANGERYKPMGFTAAHRKLPFGTKLRVTNLRTGKSVVVRVNDRGPFIKGRIIDLSMGAAKAIGLTATGVGKVRYTIID